MAHAPESIPIQCPDQTMIFPISYHLQLSVISLNHIHEGSTPRLQTPITVQAPQLPIPTRPVGKGESILMSLNDHPVGSGEEVPFRVVFLVAVRLVVVGTGGG